MTLALIVPQVLPTPFAENGTKNTIPNAVTDTNEASIDEGFPLVTSKPLGEGGIPPERADFNGIFNLISQFCYLYQTGGFQSFRSAVSSAIGGYPIGARLQYSDTNGNTFYIESLIENNTNAPSQLNIQFSNSGTGTYYWKVVNMRASNEAVVIKTYRSGDSWYKVWSDGSIEQGGVVAISGNDGNGIKAVTVSLLIPMPNSNYSVNVVSDNGYCFASYGTRGTSTLEVRSSNRAGNVAPAGNVSWIIKGLA